VKLSQLILLLLRCLFLTCIVLALASPAWKTNPAGQKNGWVLIPPEGFAATYQHFQPKVDSLLQAGFELHLFDEKFQKVSPAMAPAAHDSSQEPVVSYRRLVAALDDHLPAQLPVYIFSDNYLRHFSGSRVPVSLNLNWYDYTPAADTIRDEMNPAPVTVTILAKKASIDSRYLSAVLKAISDYSGRSITLNLVEGAHDIKPGTDWLFCLDGNKPDKGQVVDHLVEYATGKEIEQSSYILPAGVSIFEGIKLYRRIEDSISSGAVELIWKDGFGHALLTRSNNAGKENYILYTRFDPAWNDLPLSGQFPQLIAELMFPVNPHEKPGGPKDLATISHAQLMPFLRAHADSLSKPAFSSQVALDSIFWIIATLLFFIERVYSFYIQKKRSHA